MSGVEFDMDDFFSHLSGKETQVLAETKEAVHDAVDDLARISSEIAPIKDSHLRKNVDKKVEVSTKGVIGEVSFNITEQSKSGSRFNYALWIHEQDYKLGPRSSKAPGTDGYAVGNKYLERPLKGESDRYIKNILEAAAKGLR